RAAPGPAGRSPPAAAVAVKSAPVGCAGARSVPIAGAAPARGSAPVEAWMGPGSAASTDDRRFDPEVHPQGVCERAAQRLRVGASLESGCQPGGGESDREDPGLQIDDLGVLCDEDPRGPRQAGEGSQPFRPAVAQLLHREIAPAGLARAFSRIGRRFLPLRCRWPGRWGPSRLRRLLLRPLLLGSLLLRWLLPWFVRRTGG